MNRIVIIGASLAGGRAAETLRTEGFDGEIFLIGAEHVRPYERPPLSKALLLGGLDEDKIFLRPAAFYSEQNIALMLGRRAVGLLPQSHEVILDGGERLGYSQLLIATGSAARRLDVPGADLPGVHYLRTREEAYEVRAAISRGGKAVIVGAGFIGLEIASACRAHGLDTTVIEMLETPLEPALGKELGNIFSRIHRNRGVEIICNERVSGFRGVEHVEQVVTQSGRVVDADLVVVGVGVVAEDAWLEQSGVERSNGVLVDEFCRTSVPDVFAAGDVANAWHPSLHQHLRVEHYDNAQNQGIAAALTMLGKGEPYDPVLSFWSDQYDLKIQHAGHIHGHKHIVYRGDLESPAWSAFYLRDRRVAAVLAVNRPRDIVAGRQLIRRQIEVTNDVLQDEDLDLRKWAREH